MGAPENNIIGYAKRKVPEKIVLQEPTKVRTEKLYDNDVEYIRTDVFIDKACEWIKYNNENGGCIFDGWKEDFKKYMEE